MGSKTLSTKIGIAVFAMAFAMSSLTYAGPLQKFFRERSGGDGTVESEKTTTVTTGSGKTATVEKTREASVESPGSVSEEMTDLWVGKWNTTYGDLAIKQQSGSKVCGVYKYDVGRLTNCTMTKTSLSGTWVESGAQTGPFKFVLGANGKSFKGKWGYAGEAPSKDWNGTKK